MKVLPLKRFVDPSRPITYGIVQAGDDVVGGVPYIRPIDMVGHSGVPDPSLLRTTSAAIAAAYRRSTVLQGDIVVSIGPSYGKTMEVPPELDGANLTQGTARVAPAAGVDGRYIRWALQSQSSVAHWDAAVGGATFRALNLEPLSNTPIPAWTLANQRAVCDYLDTETSRIDALIASKRRMIQLLQERWQATVARAVTEGVDTGSSYRRVDKLWAERVKEGWDVLPLRRRWSVIDCKHVTPEYVLAGFPLVSHGEIVDGRARPDLARHFVGEVDYKNLIEGRQPRSGDVIYTRNASIGNAGYVQGEVEFAMGQDVCLIRSQREDQRFLTFFLNGLAKRQLDANRLGATFDRINVSQILDLEVPYPLPDEQSEIADALVERKKSVDRILDLLERQVGLLAEHRQALITGAVTGGIGIPGAAE